MIIEALWVDGMVIIGHGSSKSTFGANNIYNNNKDKNNNNNQCCLWWVTIYLFALSLVTSANAVNGTFHSLVTISHNLVLSLSFPTGFTRGTLVCSSVWGQLSLDLTPSLSLLLGDQHQSLSPQRRPSHGASLPILTLRIHKCVLIVVFSHC